MTRVTAFIKNHPVLAYFALTFILTWGCMLLVVGPIGFPISAEQLETTGALVYVAMLVGPCISGLLLTGLLYGRDGYRELLSKLLHWKTEARWYALALLTAPLVAMAILLALSIISPEFSPGILNSDNALILLLSWFAGGLMIAIFEELGWTGFAIPQMRKRYSVLATGIIVGLIWGLWHFLPFWESDSFSSALPFALLLARLFAWLPPYRILMVRVYDETGSLLVTILMHASLVMTLQAIVPSQLTGIQLLTWLVVWAVALWVVATVDSIQQRAVHRKEPLQSKQATA